MKPVTLYPITAEEIIITAPSQIVLKSSIINLFVTSII